MLVLFQERTRFLLKASLVFYPAFWFLDLGAVPLCLVVSWPLPRHLAGLAKPRELLRWSHSITRAKPDQLRESVSSYGAGLFPRGFFLGSG